MSLPTILGFLFCIFVTMYMYICNDFRFQTFLKYCKALRTEKDKRYINILLFYYYYYYS